MTTVLPEEVDLLIIVYFSKCESLLKFNNETVHHKVKYLIVVPHYLATQCKDNFQEIGKYVVDVTFILEDANTDIFLLATFIPEINNVTCNKDIGDTLIINNCQNGILESSIIFPNKNPKDLKKCPINVGITSFYPLVTFQDKFKLKPYEKLNESQITGLDLDLLKIAAKQYNATLSYNYIEDSNNYAQNEFLQFLLNGSLDICAGGFYRTYADLVSYSGIYVRQHLIWLYTVDRKDKSWKNIVHKVNGLYIFIIYYATYCCIWYLICKFDKPAVSFIRSSISAWGALVGAGSLLDARSLKQKIINLMYLITCLHLSVYVGTQLYSFYTIFGPPERLETMEDLLQSGKPVYLMSSFKNFINDDKYMNLGKESSDCYSLSDCVQKSLIYKGITLIMEGTFIYYQAQSAVNDEARMLRTTENVLTIYNEILIRKNSEYVSKFQDIVKRLFEAGISEKLYIEAYGLTVVDRAKVASKNIIANSYSCQAGCKISLDQLDGAFYTWLVGCCISFSVFIFECVRKRV